jgi:hypothetical protein
MQQLRYAIALAVVSGIGSATVAAQAIPMRPAYQYPAKPEAGPSSVQIPNTPLYVAPFIGTAVGHDDNMFYRNVAQKGSNLIIASPGLKIDSRTADTVFRASYQGQFGNYTSSHDDDYRDHFANVAIDNAFGRNLFTHFGFDYVHGHDPRGSTDRTIQSSPDKYWAATPSATIAYGTPGAQGRIEAYYSDTTRRYINNRSATFLSDRDVQEFGGAFYWRIAPRTYALIDARRTDQNYKAPESPLSSTEFRTFAGVVWEATAATTGTIKVGRLEKRFDSTYAPFSATAWEGLVSWAPRTYSKFDVYSGRYPTESTGLGSFILTSATGAIWNHAWTSYLNTEINLRYQKDEYQNFSRTDDIRSLGLRAGYKFRRWLTLGAEYTYTRRDSNNDTYDYDRNLYLLTATLTM